MSKRRIEYFMDYDIYKLQQNLYNCLYECPLTIGVIYFILKDLTQEIKEAYEKHLNEEIENMKKQQQQTEQKEEINVENQDQSQD